MPAYSVGLLLSLYLAQGLPVGFLTQALPAVLRQNHVSLTAIGGFGLLMAPWGLKLLWAPLVDRCYMPRFGQSRSWIIPMQVLSVLVLLGVSLLDPTQLHQSSMLLAFFVLLLLLNFFGATQDIATDALAVRVLQRDSQHWGNALQVLGSRLGFIIGGGAMLLLLDVWSWHNVFLLLTVFVLLNSLPVLFYREPAWPHQTIIVEDKMQPEQILYSRLFQFFKTEFSYFWHSSLMRRWLIVLISFKLGDGLSAAMVKPMMIDMGFKLSDIGLMVSMLGAGAALLGALTAAWWMRHLNRFNALWLFNIVQAVAIFLYALLAWQYQANGVVVPWQLYGANVIEHVASAMVLVAMLTIVMDYSRKRQAGSDFTFQVSVMATITGLTHIVSGALADWWGYGVHFMVSAGLALFCLWPMYIWRKYAVQVE